MGAVDGKVPMSSGKENMCIADVILGLNEREE
jgi:hypothetical protein